jgi:hypothetical protein
MSFKRDGSALPKLTEEKEDEQNTAALCESGQDNIHFKVIVQLCAAMLTYKLFLRKDVTRQKFGYWNCKLIVDSSQQWSYLNPEFFPFA